MIAVLSSRRVCSIASLLSVGRAAFFPVDWVHTKLSAEVVATSGAHRGAPRGRGGFDLGLISRSYIGVLHANRQRCRLAVYSLGSPGAGMRITSTVRLGKLDFNIFLGGEKNHENLQVL